MAIIKISIEEGCIGCSLCEDIAPDVFEVIDDDDCRIRSGAKDFFGSKRDDIILAAEDCPVDVIRVDENGSPGDST